MGKFHVQTAQAGRRRVILVSLVALAGMSILIVPWVVLERRELAAVERLAVEARRLGGHASSPEGGIASLGLRIDVLLEMRGAGVERVMSLSPVADVV